jgi:hypothetical protein
MMREKVPSPITGAAPSGLAPMRQSRLTLALASIAVLLLLFQGGLDHFFVTSKKQNAKRTVVGARSTRLSGDGDAVHGGSASGTSSSLRSGRSSSRSPKDAQHQEEEEPQREAPASSSSSTSATGPSRPTVCDQVLHPACWAWHNDPEIKALRLRIVLVGNELYQQLPTIGYGGIETSVDNTADSLHKMGVKFAAIVPRVYVKRTILKFLFIL